MTRSLFSRKPATMALCGALSLALLLVLAACSSNSSSKKVAADQWGKDVCTAAKPVTDQLAAQDAAFAKVDTSDNAAFKAALLQQLDLDKKADDSFRGNYDKIGLPDIDNAKQVNDAFIAGFASQDKQLNDAKTLVDKLDPKSSTFQDDLSKIGDIPEQDFKATLTKISGAQPVVDSISANTDCASALFSNSAEDSGSGSATPAGSPPAGSKGTPGASASASGTNAAGQPRTTNEKWVSGLCTAASGFATDIETLGKNFNPTSDMSSSQIKDLIVKFLNQADDRAKQLRSDIDKLGNPDVKDGDKIETAFSTAAGKVVTSFDDAVTTTQKLDESDVTALVDGLTQVGDDLDSASSTIDDAFTSISNDYDTSPLSNISVGRPECAGLFN
ncbi:MAG: hypothetical protein ACRDG3_13275 [Tepidiformaceae bacterium]